MRYKEVLRQHVEEHRIPSIIRKKSKETLQEFPKAILDFENKLKAIVEKKKEKEFIINISLPKFLLEQNETFEQRNDSKENKITVNKEKKVTILQREKKKTENSQESLFDKKVKEISSKYSNDTKKLFPEINPFMNFKLDTCPLKSFFF